MKNGMLCPGEQCERQGYILHLEALMRSRYRHYKSVLGAGVNCYKCDNLSCERGKRMTFSIVRVSVSLLIFCLDVNYQSFMQRIENPAILFT
jgi:hypothetical protein